MNLNISIETTCDLSEELIKQYDFFVEHNYNFDVEYEYLKIFLLLLKKLTFS